MYIPKSIKLSIITTSIMLGMSTLPSHAQIPVIDTSNIMQQAKTLAETVKVVTNTAQQIQLQLQELKSWPEEQLNKLTAKFDGGIQKITDTINSKTSILGDLIKELVKKDGLKKAVLVLMKLKSFFLNLSQKLAPLLTLLPTKMPSRHLSVMVGVYCPKAI